MTHESMRFDVAIVGAGPAGLAAAIRLKQLRPEAEVCVLEKGAEVGAHILSGCALDVRALNELLPDWETRGAPITVKATRDDFFLLTPTRALRLPTPPQMKNHGNYVVSLGEVCRWLAVQAEAMGVQIFPGFAAADIIIENGALKGVVTGEFGRGKDGNEKPSYQPGIAINATYTLFAEGCRGSLSQKLMQTFDLCKHASPQTYALGIKEVWEIPSELHTPGAVMHSVGWPLDMKTYGGGFVYHMDRNTLALGFVTGLDYENPWLDPYQEFQRFKTHPLLRPILENGKRVVYGARTLSEGGWQSLPQLAFPGGALIGDAAGTLNVPKIKGTHMAMKSGMVAAEAIADALALSSPPPLLDDYEPGFRNSWAGKELRAARNIRPSFQKGLMRGLIYSAIDTYLFAGKAPWTLNIHAPDHARLKSIEHAPRIAYPAPDGKVTFDRMSSVYLSNTHHEEDQPSHLRLKDTAIPTSLNLPVYAAPEERYCPAGVYEMVEKNGTASLAIHAANCVHCKACDIKDPSQNIVWTAPEGGGGPNYGRM